MEGSAPMILDTHIHAPATREQMIRDLRRRVYWGVGAGMSMGTDTTDVVFKIRDETRNMPGTARLLTAGRGVTGIETRREQSAYWVGTVAEARQVRTGEREAAAGHEFLSMMKQRPNITVNPNLPSPARTWDIASDPNC